MISFEYLYSTETFIKLSCLNVELLFSICIAIYILVLYVLGN